MAAYDRHLSDVRRSVDAERLLAWEPADGWEPLCRALGTPVPEDRFPWTNRREEWS